MTTVASTERSAEDTRPRPRYFTAALVLLTGCGYPALILLGKVSQVNRLSPSELALAAVGLATATAIAIPRLLHNVRRIKVSGLEVEVDNLRHQQESQRNRIDEIDMLLPLLMPDAQFQHLDNLLKKNTAKYRGGRAVCDELRRLAETGLVRRLPGRTLAELAADRELDLADYVELTESGAQWGKRYVAHKSKVAAERERLETVGRDAVSKG